MQKRHHVKSKPGSKGMIYQVFKPNTKMSLNNCFRNLASSLSYIKLLTSPSVQAFFMKYLSYAFQSSVWAADTQAMKQRPLPELFRQILSVFPRQDRKVPPSSCDGGMTSAPNKLPPCAKLTCPWELEAKGQTCPRTRHTVWGRGVRGRFS